MARYFFHVNHPGLSPDPELRGVELPDIHAAWSEATKHAGDLLKEIDGNLRPGHD
jgi:hypothetical protein